LNLLRASDIRQEEIHTAGPLVTDPTTFGAEIAIEKWKNYKWPGSVQISAELNHTGGETLRSEIRKFINSLRSKEELSDQSKSSLLYQFT
jgi:hypothetical protein